MSGLKTYVKQKIKQLKIYFSYENLLTLMYRSTYILIDSAIIV